ncbi:MAG: ATP-binding protein [Planctomycetota bacterium]
MNSEDHRPGTWIESLLDNLERGILEKPDLDGAPDDRLELCRALERVRAKWERERRQTVESAVGALERSTEVYRRERERADDLRDAHAQIRRAQSQLIQANKLSSLGTLAAGVAHEMHQPLSVILGLADLIHEQPGTQVTQHLSELQLIARAAEQLGEIVDNIRTFGRQSSLSLGGAPATRPLLQAIGLFRSGRQFEGIVLECNFDETSPEELLLDENRMQQVFVNLFANAKDALLERPNDNDRPRIRLEVQNEEGLVRYLVADNGPGAKPGEEHKLFDPFFTTKEAGKGTGLGLSVAYSIVEDHGGTLSYRREDPWTVIQVELPRKVVPRGIERDEETSSELTT